MPAPDRDADTNNSSSLALNSLRRHIVFGAVTVLVLFGGMAGWLSFASLSGAVVASGKMVVESNAKVVQHPDGGIVGKIFVRDGDRVHAGDMLVRLDATQARASLGIVESQIDALSATEMRLVAERDDAIAPVVPQILATRADQPDIAALVHAQIRLFNARQTSLMGEKQQLEQKRSQLHERIGGLEAQKTANVEQHRHIIDELTGLEMLFAKQLVPITRVAALRREKASLEGQRGELSAEIAAAQMQIAETQMAILQLERDRQTDVLTDLADTDSQLAELKQKQIALVDQLRRTDIRAPYDGTIYQMQVHSEGGVIGAGEKIMGIVPDQDALVIEARTRPQDVDQIHPGQKAMLRFTAFNRRTTPELAGTVDFVAADLSRDEVTGESFYPVRMHITQGELSRLGDHPLIPGMPVETFIATGERTALSYFAKPLLDQFARAFREE
ncbi:hemolysin secretion protein D [Thalassospira mesophila]|uniref:Membrane fusion protein (MFP) family protein n=1 Tax=Thalassospira mesophila TaxID=1293891 RepID=A0A1Y2L504_9PROT|nr:hemolysin secretion protein D [Thalassospira mesophila]